MHTTKDGQNQTSLTHNCPKWGVKLALGFLVLVPGIFCMGESPESGKRLPTQWGEATNNVRAGINIFYQEQVWGTPPICSLNLQYVGSNTFGLRFPKIEQRYKMELLGPDAITIPLKSAARITQVSRSRMSTFRPNEEYPIDTFSIPDAFKVRTNGQHTLIVSVWVSTNYLGLRGTQYFLTPPVTNTFDVPKSFLTGLVPSRQVTVKGLVPSIDTNSPPQKQRENVVTPTPR